MRWAKLVERPRAASTVTNRIFHQLMMRTRDDLSLTLGTVE
jgi:hypothetical protein